MIQEQIQIHAPLPSVYDVFAGLSHWRAALPDVLSVGVLYDDGRHQEFLMTVERPNGPETIRGIRYLDRPNRIELFQPTPPPGFRRMCGSWHFSGAGQATRVTATRTFELEVPGAAAAVADKLGGFLRTNLQLFKRYIEDGSH
jgi:hypothetical protein